MAGVRDRKTKQVHAEVVQDTDKDTLQGFVEAHVEPKAEKYTDEARAYQGLSNHGTCKHSGATPVRWRVECFRPIWPSVAVVEW